MPAARLAASLRAGRGRKGRRLAAFTGQGWMHARSFYALWLLDWQPAAMSEPLHSCSPVRLVAAHTPGPRVQRTLAARDVAQRLAHFVDVVLHRRRHHGAGGCGFQQGAAWWEGQQGTGLSGKGGAGSGQRQTRPCCCLVEDPGPRQRPFVSSSACICPPAACPAPHCRCCNHHSTQQAPRAVRQPPNLPRALPNAPNLAQ